MDILRELTRSISEILDKHLDEIELSILRVFAFYGSISLYKASTLAGFAVSTTYKKAKKLIELGFLKNDTTHTYRITPKGLLQCIAQDFENAPYMIHRIKLLWRLNSKFEELCAYLILLSRGIKLSKLHLSQIDELESFRETAKYVFTPIMYTILSTSSNMSISDLISKSLNVNPEIVRMCEKLLIRAFNDFFAIFTLRMLSIIAGSKSRAVILIYDGDSTIDVLDLCNTPIEYLNYKVRKYREQDSNICKA